jgi:L-iditol 2-dehydrogenase
MKTLFLSSPQTFTWEETPSPELPEGFVRVRMKHVGICGSDVHYYAAGRIGDQVVEYPHVLGHEGGGEVIEGGGFAPGTQVFVEPAWVCHECDQCKSERENTCRNIKFMGNPGERYGCMSEEVVLPADCVFPLATPMTTVDGLLLEPLCIGYYSVLRSRFPAGGTAAIVGSGPIGLSVLLSLSDFAPSAVYASDPVAPRRAAAEHLGATQTFDPSPLETGARKAVRTACPEGVDVAFECVGTQESIDDCVAMLKPGGTLMLVGIPETLDYVRFNPNVVRRNEITLINVRRQNRCIEQSLDLLARRPDFKDALVTHHFQPGQAKEAFEIVRERRDGVIKAVIDF